MIIIHWKLLLSVQLHWNPSSMLPCDFWHVFTQPHTQHLHLDTSVLTKKRQEKYLRMPVTTLLARPRVLSRIVLIPLSWLQEINILASSKLVFSLRRSHSGETQSGPLVFLNPATGVVKQLTFNTLALSSSYAACVCAHVCFSSDRPTLKPKYYTLAAVKIVYNTRWDKMKALTRTCN